MQKSLDSYQTANDFDPDNLEDLDRLAFLYIRLEKYDKAKKIGNKLIEIGKSLENERIVGIGNRYLGQIAINQKQFSEATNYQLIGLEKFSEGRHKNELAMHMLDASISVYRQGEPERAMGLCCAACAASRHPLVDAHIGVLSGHLYKEMSKPDKAKKEWIKSEKLYNTFQPESAEGVKDLIQDLDNE